MMLPPCFWKKSYWQAVQTAEMQDRLKQSERVIFIKRRIGCPTKQIQVLKLEIEKLNNTSANMLADSPRRASFLSYSALIVLFFSIGILVYCIFLAYEK